MAQSSRPNRPVVIVGGLRTPFVKSMTKYERVSNKDMAIAVLKAIVEKYRLQRG